MVGPEDPGLVVQKRLKHGDGFLIIPQNAVGAGEIAARVQSVRVINAQGAELAVQDGLEYLNGFQLFLSDWVFLSFFIKIVRRPLTMLQRRKIKC